MARILLVDDEHNIRLMVSLALRHVGHEVETASDGVEAIEKFADGRSWDLVLLDQRMPGPQGLDVLQAMRRTDPNCRVIIITAYGTVDLAREAMTLGARDLLRKPFTTDMLRGVVSAALSESSGAPAPVIAVNGYRVRPAHSIEETTSGVRMTFSVSTPSQTIETCAVEVRHDVADQAQAHAVRHAQRAFRRPADLWRIIGEELLANYLWQNADLPVNRLLCADELTSAMRRRLDAVAPERVSAQEAHHA